MRLKLVSDGTPLGTRVVCAETGERLQRVIRQELYQDAERPGEQRLLVEVRVVQGDERQAKRTKADLVNDLFIRNLITGDDVRLLLDGQTLGYAAEQLP